MMRTTDIVEPREAAELGDALDAVMRDVRRRAENDTTNRPAIVRALRRVIDTFEAATSTLEAAREHRTDGQRCWCNSSVIHV